MRVSPRSPRSNTRTFPLGLAWNEKTLLNDSDNPMTHRDRLNREIQAAMACGQTHVVMFKLRERDAELTAVPASVKPYVDVDNETYLWFPVENGKALIPIAGYRLNPRFLGLLRWLRQSGVGVTLRSNLTLIAYWHAETGHADCANTLYKVALSQWIAGDDEDIMAQYRRVIARAMACGQTRTVICIVYQGSGYEQLTHVTSSSGSSRSRVCGETRDIITDEILGPQQWYMTSKHESLLRWLTDTEQLQWSLRFAFCSHNSIELYPWALLVATWGNK